MTTYAFVMTSPMLSYLKTLTLFTPFFLLTGILQAWKEAEVEMKIARHGLPEELSEGYTF